MERVNLVLDRGNTRIKAGIFQGRELIEQHYIYSSDDLSSSFGRWENSFEINKEVILSDTRGGDLPNLPSSLEINPLKRYKSLPVEIDYLSPETLGDDRIANAAFIAQKYPDDDVLLIDAGTCITTNLISKKRFLGGSISPGLSMRYKALNHYTGALPLLEIPEDGVEIIGKDSANSIHSGVMLGTILELQGRINENKTNYPHLKVALTGGDMLHFENHLKYLIFADSNLTLKGLNEILIFNH